MKKLLMGNEAIAWGALHAGVGLICGYPGTPSTEVLETVAKLKQKGRIPDVYVEWSINEKSAMEVAAGAAYCGMRTLVTMKQVGLNVASDPLMSLEYVGVEGGMVILVADDPGPISSQTEQDTRSFGRFSRVPVFDPSSPEEAYAMMEEAYAFSEKYHTPVFLRPTTRICHANAVIDLPEEAPRTKKPKGFVKDADRWVIFPKLSYRNHLQIEERNDQLRGVLSDYEKNQIMTFGTYSGSALADCAKSTRLGIACGGVSVAYALEALQQLGILAEDGAGRGDKSAGCGENSVKLLKVATPYPFPEKLAAEFLKDLDAVLVYEELDPVIERELALVCHNYGLKTKIFGKLTGQVRRAGENSADEAAKCIADFLQLPESCRPKPAYTPDVPLPVRPPSLCAGCPHRASFYAVKKAMEGKKAVFAGDIGCYTLGNAQPLDMTDTCLCMGAGITVAQGIRRAEPDTVCFSFTGDSTFYHTGLAGIANAVYNDTRMVAVILDNSTTAMTGHQPNPNTGRRADGEAAAVIDIEKVLRALGVRDVQTVDPLDFDGAKSAVQKAVAVSEAPSSEGGGVAAIIFRSPCIALFKPPAACHVEQDVCIGCLQCITELGCPAVVKDGEKIRIDGNLCYGCGLCEKICPTGAITAERSAGGEKK